MSGWLVDTNVVSELRKTNPNPTVKAWSDAQASHRLFLSTVTLAEIRYGIERQQDAALHEELRLWLDLELRPWFAGRILAIDEEVLLEWRRMVVSGRSRGIIFSHPDVFIAATARVHGLAVCTRDERGFQSAGISVLNPWRLDGEALLLRN